ncbi:MAG: hypothetical protein WDZ34_02395 [Candidatus Saccharimonadales bacterium]
MVRIRHRAVKAVRYIKKVDKIYLLVGSLTILLIIGSVTLVGLKTKTVDTEESSKLVEQLLAPCNDKSCVWDAAEKLTELYGPAIALSALELYESSGQAVGDTHEWGHIVGRQTAETYGATGESFLKCPTSFNYGCQHGFFEKVLGESDSTRSAVDQICGQLETDNNYSQKFKFYCYHGVGHGIMQSYAYDLTQSLDICDSLSTRMAQDGCWQGVFMENINGEMYGKSEAGIFLADDPLAPCSRLDIKYQHECYINHSAHLMKIYNGSVKQASEACLKARADKIESCLLSIGLMTANDTWLPNLRPATSGPVVNRAWKLCLEFPKGYVDTCVEGAVDNILQFDELNLGRADTLCKLVDATIRQPCYRRIGYAVRAQVVNNSAAQNKCSQFAAVDKTACLEGAGV